VAKRLEFSEFTYGYALTENLGRLNPIKAVPVFPTLIDEGKKAGGYDVAIAAGGSLPLLLQFKVPQVMTRPSKWMPPKFVPPYYRAHLRTRLNDEGFCQHAALLAHESAGYCVYYATPRFHTSSALEALFLTGEMVARSAFVRPSAIGPLTDEDHYLAYSPSTADVWRKSDLVQLSGPMDSGHFLSRLRAEMSTRARGEVVDFRRVLESMVNAIESVRPAGSASDLPHVTVEDEWTQSRIPPRLAANRLLENRTPVAAAATFARLWLDSELVVASLNEQEGPLGS